MTLNPGIRPLGLVAEITHQCPLHCPYCSNPTQYPTGKELSTAQWCRVLGEAADMGVLHALFSGGEPLGRADLEELVAAARGAGLYTNLITSAVGLDERRVGALVGAGLDAVQISFQGDEPAEADRLAGARAHARKLAAARLVRAAALPLSVNVVLHRQNIERAQAMVDLAQGLGATRLELAHTQFYGWAFANRSALLPTRAQVQAAGEVAAAARVRWAGVMDVLYVEADYFADRPKPCMNGWGRRYLTVNPLGDVLPCPTAGGIAGLRFDNVAAHDLRWIWEHSESFNRFRGTDWMPELCRTCERKEIDFGGCRCQAALLTGDPARTDPVCGLSGDRALVDRALAEAGASTLHFRSNPQ